MAWRPTQYLIEGELDNTTPGKVTGWMRFAGLTELVVFNLAGDFHRDIRGAKIRLTGDGQADDPDGAAFLQGFASEQTGDVGDITAGLPPADYVSGYAYIEWYSERNGRVVLELGQDQVQVIGRPIPACESDPISREQQAQHMAKFLGALSRSLGVPALTLDAGIVSDPAFSHWVIEQGRILGEARDVTTQSDGSSFAYVRLFSMPEYAEYGSVPAGNLIPKPNA